MTIAASAFYSLHPDQVSDELEVNFFGNLKTSNNTFKKTDIGRFSEIDLKLAATLSAMGLEEIALLDVAISSGVTTLELKEQLEEAGIATRVVGTDQSFEAYIVPGPLAGKVLAQPDGHILQYELFGQPFRGWSRKLDRLTGRVLFNGLLKAIFRGTAMGATSNTKARRVELVSQRLRHAIDVSLIEDDILRRNGAFERRFDLIRAANILNVDYFDRDSLRAALRNLRSYLRGPGSLLLVVRTDKRTGLNNGSLCRLEKAGQFQIVERFGAGSEVEDLIADAGQ